MKVKLDENVPASLARMLNERGHDSIAVPEEGLAGQSDAVIWETAQREERLLVTMDLDFTDIRIFPPGTHKGLLILRPSRQGRQAIADLLQVVLAEHSLDSFKGCMVVADQRAVRVRRP